MSLNKKKTPSWGRSLEANQKAFDHIVLLVTTCNILQEQIQNLKIELMLKEGWKRNHVKSPTLNRPNRVRIFWEPPKELARVKFKNYAFMTDAWLRHASKYRTSVSVCEGCIAEGLGIRLTHQKWCKEKVTGKIHTEFQKTKSRK